MQALKPKLSILIATQGRRNTKFRRLLKELMRQVRAAKGDIEVIAYWNNGESPIGIIRQDLLKEAKGEYICFIDDDDEIPEYYCEEILNALGKDYVGFRVQVFDEEVENKQAIHSLQYRIWTEDDKYFYRGVTHLNPIKRKIALKGDFGIRESMGEDAEWARSIAYLPSEENFIDKIMYIYRHNRNDSSFGGDYKISNQGYIRPKLNYRYFHYHPKSKQLSKEAKLWLNQ